MDMGLVTLYQVNLRKNISQTAIWFVNVKNRSFFQLVIIGGRAVGRVLLFFQENGLRTSHQSIRYRSGLREGKKKRANRKWPVWVLISEYLSYFK